MASRQRRVGHPAEQPGSLRSLHSGVRYSTAISRWCSGWPATADRLDDDGTTPLHAAAFNGHLEMVQWLAGNGGSATTHVRESQMTDIFLTDSRAALVGHAAFVIAMPAAALPAALGCCLGR